MPQLNVNTDRPTESRCEGRGGKAVVHTRADEILLRVVVGEEDRYGGQLLYIAIVERALDEGLAGATVLPGIEGFGASGYIRFDSNIEAVPRLPMAVEIVDTEAKIHQFLPQIEEMIDSGLVSLERVCAIHYCLPSAVVPAWQKHKPSARQC